MQLTPLSLCLVIGIGNWKFPISLYMTVAVGAFVQEEGWNFRGDQAVFLDAFGPDGI